MGTEDWDALFRTPELSRGPSVPATTTSPGSGAAGFETEGELPRPEPPPGASPAPAADPASAAATWMTTAPDLMQFTADYTEYDRKGGRVLLKGSAVAVYGDMKLWAEAIEAELDSGRLYASGNVRFVRPGDDITGASLDYNYKLREGSMTKIVTWRGPNKVVAQKLDLYANKLVGYELYTTTCDRDPPHYRVQATLGTLYPGDKLILEHAALKVGRKRIVSFPRYKVSLRNRQSQFYIRPGYSNSRGFTLDSSYDFYFSEHEYGRLLYSGTSRAGGNGGVLFLYGAGQPTGGEVRLFHNEVRIEDVGASQFLNQASSSASWVHRHKISSRTDLRTSLAATRIDTLGFADNEELNFNSTLTQRVPGYTLQLQTDKRVDLDGAAFPLDDAIPFLNQTPRLSFRKDEPFQLGQDFVLRFDGGFSRITEGLQGGTEIERSKSDLNFGLTGKPLELGKTRFNWNIEEKLNWYSGAADRNFFSLAINGTTPLKNGFETAYNYVLQRVNGVTPFRRFDFLDDQNVGSFFLRQRVGQQFHATWFELSHDLDRGEYRSAASNFFFHSRQGVRTPWGFGLNFRFRFDGDRQLDDMSLDAISANYRVGRGHWRHQLITNWDPGSGRLASFSTGSDFRLDEKWRLQLLTNYGRGGDGSLERTRLALAVTRDLHEWEAKLRWDVEQKEAFIEFYLKSQSRKKLGIRADYNDLAVDLDPFLGEKLNRPGPTLDEIAPP